MLYESNYLMHYRTKGSRNGERRYQNEDGSLTPEGREHYGVGEPRKAGGIGGLHDKHGNPVKVTDNIKAGYKNAPVVAKAAFKMLFNKKGKPAAAGGIAQKKDNSSTENDVKAEKPKKMSKQQKMRKAAKVMSTALKVTAAAAIIGIGIKNKDKIKEAAFLIKDAASDIHSARKMSKNYYKANLMNAKANRVMSDPTDRNRYKKAAKYLRKGTEYRNRANKIRF